MSGYAVAQPQNVSAPQEKTVETVSLQRQQSNQAGPTVLHERLFDEACRTFAEPRFGYDFSRVPAHTGMMRRAQPLLGTGTMVQRYPVNGNAESAPCTTCVGAESTETSTFAEPTTEETSPIPEAAPISTTAEPEEESTAPEETATSAFLVEDSVTELAPGQMRKSEFLAQLRAEVTRTAEAAMAGTDRTTADCPYLEYWFDYYSLRDVQHGERALHRYAPEASRATSASEYIPIIAQRVHQSVETWARTGEIEGVPEGIPMGLPGVDLLGSIGRLVSGIGGIFFKARNGGARKPNDPRAIHSQLGSGRPLDSGVRSRMESTFGRDFSGVRTHTDTTAAGLSNSLNARAFTVGEHVAFGSGEYRPGTLFGDALIAHEMAHVVQQSGAGDSVATMETGDIGYNNLEKDADESAVGALASLWGKAKGEIKGLVRNAMPSLKSGLQIQRCAASSTQVPSTVSEAAETSNCPPVLESHRWSVEKNTLLVPLHGCSLFLAKDAIRPGMKFDGFITAGPGCKGSIYFVQYANVDRVLVNCFEDRPIAFRLAPSWGIDTKWPYPSGSDYEILGGEGRAIQTEDSPGHKNISNPETRLIRVCLNDEFVTYIVFEDRSRRLTPLGWMEWKYHSMAWRDTGNCPPTSTLPNCSGWQVRVIEPGSKVAESFVPGVMHDSVQLDRSAPRLNLLTFISNVRDCSPDECQVPATGERQTETETEK